MRSRMQSFMKTSHIFGNINFGGLYRVFIVMIAVISLSACESQPKTPKAVLDKIIATVKKDKDKADINKYLSKESAIDVKHDLVIEPVKIQWQVLLKILLERISDYTVEDTRIGSDKTQALIINAGYMNADGSIERQRIGIVFVKEKENWKLYDWTLQEMEIAAGLEETFLHAVESGNVSDVKSLLKQGADANTRKKDDGSTPLMRASYLGRFDVVEILLTEGADVNAKDNDGVTALYFASHEGYSDVVRALLEKGAGIDAKDIRDGTPLHAASLKGHPTTVKILLEKGAKVDAKDVNGVTPLEIASAHGHPDVVKILLEKGADINTRDNYGITPLIASCYDGHTDVVKILLEKGAEVSSKENKGQTALDIAQENGHAEIVKLLGDAENSKGFSESSGNGTG